ncbi:MAG TPA: hypothetical protein VKY85_26875 [Candidatus Angelobacter sp.]|nr:hypothetical protein [Candidatus Angelobacter sp.]
MRGRLRFARRLIVLAVMLVAATPMAAQQKSAQRSQAGQVFLVARMPETLTLALDIRGINGMNVAAAPLPTVSVTASWVLARGRSQVVTWAHVERQAAPTLLALANPFAARLHGGTSSDAPLGYDITPRASVSSRQLNVRNIMDSNRVAASTVSLSDSIGITPGSQFVENAYIGTIKIQIQAVP